MKLKEAMTPNPKTVAIDESLEHAAKLMDTHNIGLLPVLENGRPVGVITDRDLIVRAIARGLNPKDTPVSRAMSQDLITVQEEQEIDHAIELMKKNQIARVLVNNKAGKLVGVLTASDAALCCGGDTRVGQLAAAIAKRNHAPQFADQATVL